ncbi:MAG: chorismate synthase [Clostridiales bacterium]|jgi:chorismate synthase|nr:chorismate synthase [Clostridiales bacterium]
MSGSGFGKLFRVTTWGESHGPALGAVIDGCPAGLALAPEDIQRDLDRRRPGASEFATSRAENDQAHILSGVFQGVTTGTPIAVMINNTDQRSGDYARFADIFRPGHADFGYEAKYGLRDYRGGGRSSGRETCARVAAGAVARKMLSALGVEVTAYTISVGHIRAEKIDLAEARRNPLVMPDRDAYERASEFLRTLAEQGDSSGGVAECVITGVQAGLGEPVFEKLDAMLGAAVFSIGGVKGVEFGGGFSAAALTGAENNDAFFFDGKVRKAANHAGGITGGISDGADIVFRAAFKPTPSIAKPQRTVDTAGNNVEISVTGRHDPIIVPRAIAVVEAMAAITIADAVLQNSTAKMSDLLKLYS